MLAGIRILIFVSNTNLVQLYNPPPPNFLKIQKTKKQETTTHDRLLATEHIFEWTRDSGVKSHSVVSRFWPAVCLVAMPWKGLRIGVSDGPDSKRHSMLARPQPVSRHSEQLPRPSLSASNLVPRHSESIPRSPHLTGADGDDNASDGHGDDDGGNGNNDNDGTKADNNGVSNLGVPGGRTDSSRPVTPNAGNSPASPSSPGEALSGSLRRSRFSFMKLRHASDPQLSKSYAKAEPKPPPVPAIPRKSCVDGFFFFLCHP